MSDEQAQEVYAKAGLGQSVTLGSRPAVLVVDFSCGFTDPECTLGSDMTEAVEATKRLLDAARAKGLPVDLHDDRLRAEPEGRRPLAPEGAERSATSSSAAAGSRSTRGSSRGRTRRSCSRRARPASSGRTSPRSWSAQGVDSVVLCGATTSGCIRATAIDLLQYGWPTIVPRECVADRAQAPHEANLFDIQAKYADVVSVEEALEYVESVPSHAAAGGVTHRVAVLAGDGVGPEVIREARKAVDALGLPVEWTELPWGSAWFHEHGTMMPPDALEQISGFDAVLLGAIGDPSVPDHISLWQTILEIRQKLDLWANLRPCRLLPGIPGPLAGRGPDDFDILFVRENTEGEYAGVGGRAHQGLPVRGRARDVGLHARRLRADAAARVRARGAAARDPDERDEVERVAVRLRALGRGRRRARRRVPGRPVRAGARRRA